MKNSYTCSIMFVAAMLLFLTTFLRAVYGIAQEPVDVEIEGSKFIWKEHVHPTYEVYCSSGEQALILVDRVAVDSRVLGTYDDKLIYDFCEAWHAN